MNESGHCWKCQADLEGLKFRCPKCGVRQDGPPPLPETNEDGQKLSWTVDILIFLAAPVGAWLITSISQKTWLPAIIICTLISVILLQWRSWKRSRPKFLNTVITLLFLGILIFIALIGLCLWGCGQLLKGL